jgi:hypothetical protein
LVTLAGAFDRASIMSLAIEAAKAHQIRTGAAWSVSMSVGLTAAWQAAKAARRAALSRVQGPIEQNRETSRHGVSSYSLTRSARILTTKVHRGAAGSPMPAIG